MAKDSAEKSAEMVERGEYIIGIAVILAALLVSSTIYIGLSGIQDTIGKLKLTAPSTGQPSGQPSQAAPSGPGEELAFPMLKQPDLSGEYLAGNKSADIVFIEYTDFQCPYCKRAAATLGQLKKEYSSSVAFAVREFPLPAYIHPDAQRAAEAAECAGMQGKFWEMHDALYANQNQLSLGDLKRLASGIVPDAASFSDCLEKGKAAPIVEAEKKEGSEAGISGTPGFLIYSKKGRDKQVEKRLLAISDRFRSLGVSSAVVSVEGAGPGIVFAGAMSYSDFKEVIEAFR